MLMARKKRGETGDTPYEEFTRTGGVPVRAWTRGVLFEDAAQRQLLNIARLPFVHSHVAAMPRTTGCALAAWPSTSSPW